MTKLARQKLGITLTEETIDSLEKICKKMGLSKSQAISLAINTYALEKFEADERKNTKN